MVLASGMLTSRVGTSGGHLSGYGVNQELGLQSSGLDVLTFAAGEEEPKKFNGKVSEPRFVSQNDDVGNSCRPNRANGYLHIAISCPSVCGQIDLFFRARLQCCLYQKR